MTTSHVKIPRPLTVAVSSFSPLVDKFLELDDGHLIIRLGEMSGGIWRDGIVETRFEEILSAMDAYTGWDEVGGWKDLHEYEFRVGDEHICTEVHIGDGVNVSHATKTHLEVLNLKLMNHGFARGMVNIHTPVCSNKIPETVTPERVWIRKKKVYTLKYWRFTAMYVWKGDSRTLAEEAQSKGDTEFCIEVELCPDPGFWGGASSSPTYIATSMLMKVVDLISSEMVSVEPCK